MKHIDEAQEFLLAAQPIADIVHKKLNYMYNTPKRGYISQESRNKARKRNRKRK